MVGRCEGRGFPPDMGIAMGNIWHLRLGLDSQPGVVFAGSDPAGLFRSDDGGVSWASVEGINRHKLRPFWRPVPGPEQGVMEVWMEEGEDAAQEILDHIDEPIEDDLTRRRAGVQGDLGGMAHSIEIDPRDASRMYVSISAGGSYVTSDDGETWEMSQHQPEPVEPVGEALISQVAANVDAGVDPAAHFDMHTMRLDSKCPDRIWGQADVGRRLTRPAGVPRLPDRGHARRAGRRLHRAAGERRLPRRRRTVDGLPRAHRGSH